VLVRHEQAAGFAADGYARISGRPAAAFVISGPGVTNILTATAQAYSDSVPMLIIASSPVRASLGSKWGVLHELTDQRALVGAMLDTARAADSAEAVGAQLRIALASTLPIAAPMQWLTAAQRQIAFDVEISEGTAEAVAERWRRGRCDIALFAARHAITAANAVSLWREPYLLAAAANHLIATRDRWSVKDLADTPFVLRAACEAHDEAQRTFAAEGVRPRAVLRSADEERCAAAVLAGLGVSLMPRSLLRPGLAAAEIREVALERRVMLGWRVETDSELLGILRETALAHTWPGRVGTRDGRLDFAR